MMVEVVGDDRVKFGVIKAVTKGLDGLARGMLHEDARMCIIASEGVITCINITYLKGDS